MRRFFVVASMALAILIATSLVAQAGLLPSRLTIDGNPDVLEDDSRGIGVNFDADDPMTGGFVESNRLTVGDVIFGIVRIDTSLTGGIPGSFVPPRIVAIYALEVESTEGGVLSFGGIDPDTDDVANPTGDDAPLGNGATLTGNVPGDRRGMALKSILGDMGFDTTILDDPTWASSGFAVLTQNADVNPLDTDTTSTLNGYGVMTAALGASDWDLEMVLGFKELDDFYQVRPSGPPTATATALDRLRGEAGTVSVSTSFAVLSGGLSVMYDVNGLVLTDVEADNLALDVVTSHQVSLTGDLRPITTANRTGPLDEWMWTDNAFVSLNAVGIVPEPASMLAWSGLSGLALLVGRYRRRRRLEK